MRIRAAKWQHCHGRGDSGLLMHWGRHSQVSKSTRICHLVLPLYVAGPWRTGEDRKERIWTFWLIMQAKSRSLNFAHSLSAGLRQTPLFLFGAPWNSQTSPCTLLATLSEHTEMRTGITTMWPRTHNLWKSPRRSDFLLMYIKRFQLPCLSALILTVQSDSSDSVFIGVLLGLKATKGGTISAIWLTNVITLGLSLFQPLYHPIDSILLSQQKPRW